MAPITRRTALVAGMSAAPALLAAGGAKANARAPYKAMAFDALAVFDPRPIAARAERLFPSKGAGLMQLWRTRQFEYAWLRTITGQYRDFMRVTEDALIYAAAASDLALAAADRDALMQLYLELGPWPDSAPVLRGLKAAGVRLALVSNFSPAMLEGAIRSSALGDVFEHALSTDGALAYKPDPRAYRLGVDALRLRREEILFVAFAGWDAAGAKTFGHPTFWVNRLGLPAEELGAAADGAGQTLLDLQAFAYA